MPQLIVCLAKAFKSRYDTKKCEVNAVTHEDYMREALLLAGKAADAGEVPVGCVIVWEDRIIGRGRNRREEDADALAHAEMAAIRQACAAVGGWRLHKARLYVTLEPCPMCAGAIINARIPAVYFGARDEKAGPAGRCSICSRSGSIISPGW
jgi:tRNA(adenine34) deaminase